MTGEVLAVPATVKLMLLAALLSLVQGALVLGAAAAAGRSPKRAYFLGGLAWGMLVMGMMFSDCMQMGRGPSMIARTAAPIYFVGLVGFPVQMAWGQANGLRKWVLAQLILLPSLLPAFVSAVGAALCAFT